MACELIIFAGLLAVARAGIVGGGVVAAPGSVTVAQPTATVIRTENYDPNPQYSFSYSVADGLTGDNKAQEETRNGDVVQGSYSLVEPDGSRRTVSYAADPINGFNAVVQKDPAISVRTAVASSPVVAAAAPAQVLRPTVVASQSPLIAARQPVFAAAAPAAVVTSGATPILRQQAVIAGGQSYLTTAGAPLLRQSLISSPNLIGTTGIVGATPLGLGLGLRAGTLYGTQPVFATGYGTGGFVKVH